MSSGKQFDTKVEITGGVDSSLQKAVGASISELNKLQNYTRGLNKLLAQSNLAANGLTPALHKATQATGGFPASSQAHL